MGVSFGVPLVNKFVKGRVADGLWHFVLSISISTIINGHVFLKKIIDLYAQQIQS
jgi:hypothetical protein